MKFEKFNEKFYDGDSIGATDVDIIFNANHVSARVSFLNLIEFSKLEEIISHEESLSIQSELNFGVLDFDGYKVFNGRKKGLKLYGYVSKEKNEKCIFIFSCGEFQPGRFQIFLEGCLRI